MRGWRVPLGRRAQSAATWAGQLPAGRWQPRRALATAAAAGPPASGDDGAKKYEAQRLFDELRQKIGYMGAISHKKVGVLDLFRILRVARTPKDFNVCLQAMNTFYNFGVKLVHRETANRLLAAAMLCKIESEAVELIKLYGTWLEHPPETALVYATMGHFLDQGEPLVVREIAGAVRSDWRMPVEPALYVLAVEAMLRLPDHAVAEAFQLHADARVVGVRLPAPLHARLLAASLGAFEAALPPEEAGSEEVTPGGEEDDAPNAAGGPEVAGGVAREPPADALAHLERAVQAAEGLARDGHLRGGANAAALCSVAWLFLHLAALPEGVRASLLSAAPPHGIAGFLDQDWTRAVRAAMDIFGCRWGFSNQLPQGFFRALSASSDPQAGTMLEMCQRRFGRFCPVGAD